jgi:multiple sugar transport system permease protein
MATTLEPSRQPAAASGQAPRRPGRSRDAVETRVFRVLRWVVIAFLLLVTLFPFYYTVLLSIRSLDHVLQDPGALWVPPTEWVLDTYQSVLASPGSGGQGFLTFMRNSGLFLAVYLFPSILLAVPLFVFFTRIGLRGSLVGLLIVYVSQILAVSIYMLRNYFDTIPVSLEEAAAIDGCSRLGIMMRISLPLAMPAIIANALFVFMIAWNEFLFALLFLIEERDRWTVSLGLSQLAGSIEIPTTVLMAGSVIITLPIIIIFFGSERLLTEGLTAGAEKG